VGGRRCGIPGAGAPRTLTGDGSRRETRGRDVRDDADQAAAISLLVHPVRRRLYRYVQASGRAVGRDEAAMAASISRNLAAFHLDRMAEAGLLEVEHRRLSGRSGRGAGRPAKLYRTGSQRLSISLPTRRYSLASQILAAALEERRAGESGSAAARRIAGRIGAELGEELRDRVRRRADYPLGLAEEAVRELGYEPWRDADRLDLRNCPFDELAEAHRNLICPMNQALLAGLLPALGAAGVAADGPRQRPHGCCVQLRLAG
jgi:predicted ArsR family transcriptional regulator